MPQPPVRVGGIIALLLCSVQALAQPVAPVAEPPSGQETLLGTIQEGVQAALVVSSVDRLKQRIKAFADERKFPPGFMPLSKFVVEFLDGRKGLDPTRPVAVVSIANNNKDARLKIDGLSLLLPVLPGVKLEDQVLQDLVKPAQIIGRVVEANGYAVARIMGEETIVFSRDKTLQHVVTPTLAAKINAADLLLYVNPFALGNGAEGQRDRSLAKVQTWSEPRLRALGMRMVEDVFNVRHGFLAVSFADGLAGNYSVLFQNPDGTPPFIFDRLNDRPAEHTPNYNGLPNKPLLAALAIGDAATRNAEIFTALHRLDYLSLSQAINGFTNRPVDGKGLDQVVEFLAAAAKRTDGGRVAIYGHNAIAIVIDSTGPERITEGIQRIISSPAWSEEAEYSTKSGRVGDYFYDTIRLKASDADAEKSVPKELRALLGNGLKVVQIPGHVIITLESETTLLGETLDNLTADKPGLAAEFVSQPITEGQLELVDMRFHVSHFAGLLANFRAANADVKTVGPQRMSRASVTATTNELTLEVDVPRAELLNAINKTAK
jgi:hypothetical protein